MAESNSGESILAFLVGGTLGLAAGLLLAPRSGRETREQLGDWLEDNREKTREILDRSREAVTERKEKIHTAWEAGKKAFREAAG